MKEAMNFCMACRAEVKFLYKHEEQLGFKVFSKAGVSLTSEITGSQDVGSWKGPL